jgi:hypothetical protein
MYPLKNKFYPVITPCRGAKRETKKAQSFELWKVIHARIANKEHLDPVLRQELKLLATRINA